jgi:hypothetical protein
MESLQVSKLISLKKKYFKLNLLLLSTKQLQYAFHIQAIVTYHLDHRHIPQQVLLVVGHFVPV